MGDRYGLKSGVVIMKWEQQLKKGTVDYTGTCKQCGEFKERGSVCDLPAKGKGIYMSGCPMKIKGTTEDNIRMTPPSRAFRARD